jgi:hypothetical protein
MENAKLVIEFMGWRIWKPWIARIKYLDHTMVSTPYGSMDINDFDSELKCDWNWLKKVIDRIGKIPFSEKDGMREWMSIEWSDSEINIYSTKKEVYDKIVKFIKWYND